MVSIVNIVLPYVLRLNSKIDALHHHVQMSKPYMYVLTETQLSLRYSCTYVYPPKPCNILVFITVIGLNLPKHGRNAGIFVVTYYLTNIIHETIFFPTYRHQFWSIRSIFKNSPTVLQYYHDPAMISAVCSYLCATARVKSSNRLSVKFDTLPIGLAYGNSSLLFSRTV